MMSMNCGASATPNRTNAAVTVASSPNTDLDLVTVHRDARVVLVGRVVVGAAGRILLWVVAALLGAPRGDDQGPVGGGLQVDEQAVLAGRNRLATDLERRLGLQAR